jgi:hypothetical protein
MIPYNQAGRLSSSPIFAAAVTCLNDTQLYR